MKALMNTPVVKLGLVGVSRDCFPLELTARRMKALKSAASRLGLKVQAAKTIIENEAHALEAIAELWSAGCNAAVVYLGNFGPEGPATIFMQRFPGPVMVCAAAEEDAEVLARDRGDALCGLLSCSFNIGLRRLRVHIPERPVGLPDDLALELKKFESVARVVIGVSKLKVLAFGPRPQDFFACHAPLQPLYDLGIEVMENSELDLLHLFEEAAARKKEIAAVVRDMEKELGKGNTYPDLLPRLARFEVALMEFRERSLGASQYAAFANKCWPGFERAFGFVPCYVNGRLAGRGIPAACEVDLFGAVSEFMVQLAGLTPATLLDINNSVPPDILPKKIDLKAASPADLFMGFHCGNTCAAGMKNCAMNYQVIMNRLMEAGGEPDITRGTLEGQLRPGPITMFRLQSTPDGQLRSYVAEGDLLDVNPRTFGGTGVIAIPGFARFYRHALIAGRFPHHAAVGFSRTGGVLFDALKLMGVKEVSAPLPPGTLYPGENPFYREG